MFSYWAKPATHAHDLSRILNDHIASVVADHPDAFAGLGTLPLQDPDLAIRELERCSWRALAGRGADRHARQRLEPRRAGACSRSSPVRSRAGRGDFRPPVGHPGSGADEPSYWLQWLVGMPAETTVAICSVIFGGVLERLPTLAYRLRPRGRLVPRARSDASSTASRVRPDLCATRQRHFEPRRYLRAVLRGLAGSRRRGDAAVSDAARWAQSVSRSARDYPFPLGESENRESLIDIARGSRSRAEGSPAACWVVPRSIFSASTLALFGVISSERRPHRVSTPTKPFAVAPGRRGTRWPSFRDRFHLSESGRRLGPVLYFTGNSLGLQPVGAAEAVQQELDAWAWLAVGGPLCERGTPWYDVPRAVARAAGAAGRGRTRARSWP